MKMNEKELEDDLKSYQNRVRHLETLIDGLQSVRVSNANCHFNMNTDELRRSKDLLMEYSKKELKRVDEQVKIITAELGKRHYICSICNTEFSERERPEKCSNCDSTDFIPDVINFPKEWNYANSNTNTKSTRMSFHINLASDKQCDSCHKLRKDTEKSQWYSITHYERTYWYCSIKCIKAWTEKFY